jgi:hypothetical protein
MGSKDDLLGIKLKDIRACDQLSDTLDEIDISNILQITTQIFIEKAILIHGDKYDYSMVNYINTQRKAVFICELHGKFEQRPCYHLRGHGCKQCGMLASSHKKKGKENIFKFKRSNTGEFIKKAILVHGDKYGYSLVDYVDHKTKIVIVCKVHGEFYQRPNNHLCGQGCNKCAILSKSN